MRLSQSLLLLFLSLPLILTGCTSNRFINWQVHPHTVQLNTALSPQQISSLHTLKTASHEALKKNCTKTTSKEKLPLYRGLIACHYLLSKSTSDGDSTVRSGNEKLLTLLRSVDLKPSGNYQHLSIEVDKDILGQPFEQMFLTQSMVAKDPQLNPKIFTGIGVTAVAKRANSGEILDADYPLEGIFRSVTFIIEDIALSEANFQLKIRGIKLARETAHPFFTDRKLAWSPAAAFLTLINVANIDESSFQGLLRAEKAEHRFGIFAVEEFNANKTPILMIHGLQSSPLIWRKLTVAIMNNPKLHQRYQIWHAFYPSGPPPFYNAMRLRKKFDALVSRFPEQSPAAASVNLIGHSMGGVIAKTFSVNAGRSLWDVTFSEPPEFFLNEPLVDQDMKDIFIFKQLNMVDNVFFLDTPHQGSKMAQSLIGQVGAGLINLPQKFTNLFAGIINKFGVNIISPPMRPFMQSYGPNSIEVLRPGHPLMDRLNNLSLPENTWSIVGSDSELNCDTQTQCEQLTDGVVNWTSAHLADAKEEIIVRSNHDSFQNEHAIAFILEKLKN